MDRAALLADFEEKIGTYARHHLFIERARDNAETFSAAAISRVIDDHTRKAASVLDQVLAGMTALDDVVTELRSQRDAIRTESDGYQEQLQELQLRKMIGELDDARFDLEAAEVKDQVGELQAQVQVVDEELGKFRAALRQWHDIGTRAGVIAPPETVADEDSVDAQELELEEVDEDDERPVLEELELLPDG